MKKLMTMLAAVGMAFGLFADDPALTGKKSFASETLTDDYSGNITVANGWGTYSGAEGTLKIIGTEGVEDHVLEIGTGNAALSRNVEATGAARTIDATKGLFFDGFINFKGQALDEVPTLGTTDKLGLFLLDTSAMDGVTGQNIGTNLFLLAGTGAGSVRLYKLTTSVDAAFMTADHEITIKAYDNVLSGDASNGRMGFMVYIDGSAQGGEASAEFTNRMYEPNNKGEFDAASLNAPIVINKGADYLGLGTDVSVLPALSGWANDRKLFLSAYAVANQGLNAIDFKGNAKIASLEFTETAPQFVPGDAEAMTVALVGDATIAAVDSAVVYDSVAGTITVPTGITEFWIQPNFTKVIKKVMVDDDEVEEGDAGKYTITFVKDATITVSQADAAAYVTVDGGVSTPVESLEDAIEAVNDATTAGTLKLAKDVTIDSDLERMVFEGDNVTLDLNGKIITGNSASRNNTVIWNKGVLIIVDSSEGKTGKVVLAVDNKYAVLNQSGATLAIEAGIFDGKVADADEDSITATGGSFLKTEMTRAEVEAFLPAEGYQVVEDGAYWKVQVYVPPVAIVISADEVETNEYATLAAAITAATNGCTVTLLQDATTDILKKNIEKKGLTFDLGGKKLTIALTEDSKYAMQLLKDTTYTFKNGKIAVAANSWTSLTTLFQNYAHLTVEDVEIDASNLGGSNAYWTCPVVFAIMNGDVQIKGNTSIINNSGYAISIGNHADKNYLNRAVTLNTTGTLAGNFLFAGGAVTNTAATFSAGARFDYGSACTTTNSEGVCDVGTCFAISDLSGFDLHVGVGIAPVYPSGYPILSTYKVCGQLYATVADAEAVGQDKIVLFTDYALAADKTFANAVAVVAPAKITLGTYKLTTPNGDLADAAFVIPTSKKVKKTDNTGSFTYVLEDAAQPVPPGEFEPIPCDDPIEAFYLESEINVNKEKYIAAPAGIDADEYRKLFAAQTVGGDPGVSLYKVIVDLTADAKKDLQDQVNDDVAKAIADITATEATITTTPGLWYAIVGGKEVGTIATEGAEQMATGDSLTLAKPELGETTKAFYKVRVSISAKQ